MQIATEVTFHSILLFWHHQIIMDPPDKILKKKSSPFKILWESIYSVIIEWKHPPSHCYWYWMVGWGSYIFIQVCLPWDVLIGSFSPLNLYDFLLMQIILQFNFNLLLYISYSKKKMLKYDNLWIYTRRFIILQLWSWWWLYVLIPHF